MKFLILKFVNFEELIKEKGMQMKFKSIFLLGVVLFLANTLAAQRNGARIGYVDTEYILENIPEYQQALSQLEEKVQKWKTEIDQRQVTVTQKRKDLNQEKPLLTKELIEEREEDINFEAQEILDYQQKRFGPNGDLSLQKKNLIQPIQDQIFAAIQDLAEERNYDFIFDKSADVVMLFSKQRYNLSDQIIRILTRTSKREQASSKSERKAAEGEDLIPEDTTEQDARQAELEAKRAARQAELEAQRKAQQEERERLLAEREAARQAKIAEREAAHQAKLNQENNVSEESNEEVVKETGQANQKPAVPQLSPQEQRRLELEAKRAERQAELEAKRQAQKEERERLLAEREAERQAKIAEREAANNNNGNTEQTETNKN